MSEWQKVEQPPVPKEEPQPSERPSSADESPAPAPQQAKKAAPEAKPAEPADNTAPRAAHTAKRRQHPLAAPLGFLVLVLALLIFYPRTTTRALDRLWLYLRGKHRHTNVRAK